MDNRIIEFVSNLTNDNFIVLSTHDDIDLLETIRGIISSIVSIMGVKIEMGKIDKVCAVLIEDNLMSKSDYINQKYLLKGKPIPKTGKVDSQYNR